MILYQTSAAPVNRTVGGCSVKINGPSDVSLPLQVLVICVHVHHVSGGQCVPHQILLVTFSCF